MEYSVQDTKHSQTMDRPQHSTQATSKYSLLDLPAELRTPILRHLLHSSTPLLFYSQPTDPQPLWLKSYTPFLTPTPPLHPSILRTCHQLHHEGLPVLPSNTITCIIGLRHPSSHSQPTLGPPLFLSPRHSITTHSSVPGHSFYDHLPPALRQHLTSLHVDVLIDDAGATGLGGRDAFRWTQGCVDGLKRFLDAHPNYVRLQLRLRFVEAEWDPEWRTGQWWTPRSREAYRRKVRAEVLAPLRYLRGRERVVVEGVSEGLEREIGRVVSGEEVVDLWRAFDGLMKEEVWREVRRVRAGDCEGWREEAVWRAWVERCRDQVVHGNVGIFMWARGQLMEVLERYLVRAREEEERERTVQRDLLDSLARFRGVRGDRRLQLQEKREESVGSAVGVDVAGSMTQ